MSGPPPPREVLAAFGVTGVEPVPLAGGEGRSWLAANLVCKPVDDEAHAIWSAELLHRIVEDGFRVARPVKTVDGVWVSGGWTASRRVDGDHAPRWADVIAAGDAFHRAVRDEPRPAFLDARDDPWAVGDRVAWEERPVDPFLDAVPELGRLVDARRPLPDLRPQLIHGDLSENVLFAPELPPAVIDLSPYWRPPGFGSAIVLADALLWRDAGPEILEVAADVDEIGQLLIRASIYRIVTHAIFYPDDPVVPAARAAIEVARSLAGS
jgi:uncharacterized protein (TIGR02569 family)